MVNLLGYLSGKIGYVIGYLFPIIVVIFVIKAVSDKSSNNKVEFDDDTSTNCLIDDLKRKKRGSIKCQVCDKEIPYNEYGTCEECHKEILKRLENKGVKNGK